MAASPALMQRFARAALGARVALVNCMALVACVALVACDESAGPADGAVRVDSTVVGDTTIVRSSGTPPVLGPDTIVSIWRSDELERPGSLALMGDRIVVGDGTRVHIVPLDGGPVVTVGRDGEGSGEFRAIAAVGAIGDTALVHDARLLRLSRVSADGAYLGSTRMSPQVPFVNRTRDGEALVPYEGRLLGVYEENINLERPVRRAVLEYDLAADTSRVVAAWDAAAWRLIGELIGPRELFGPGAIVAIANDGRIAYGDGIDYCVSISQPDRPDVRRVCRDWQNAEVGAEIRSPDVDVIDDARSRQVLEWLLRDQQIADFLPAFDALRFGENGELWVRTMGPELAHAHPFIAARVPGRRPERRNWDVFDSAGVLVRTVELPTAFDPRVFTEGRIVGILELSSGELVIGEATGAW